jgi:hypothetical protein
VTQKTLNIRLPEREFFILARYAAATQRTKTEILRSFIRSLEPEARSTKKKATKC